MNHNDHQPPSIGQPVVRVDARAKVTGAHVYPSDHYPDDMLHLRVIKVSQVVRRPNE